MRKRHFISIAIFFMLLITGTIVVPYALKHHQLFQRNAQAATDCTPNAILVNPCRPLFGASSNNYPNVANDKKSQLLAHEVRIGKKLDIVRNYHSVGDNQLSSIDLYFVNRTDAQTTLMITWKPTSKWGLANGSDATVKAGIDKMALSIKAVAPKKIFLTIHHEPENDVSGGGTCTSYKGSFGTTTDYKNMWRYIRSEFNRLGVTNVVWFVNFMNYPQWDCVFEELYPGDDLVDWIFFGGYGTADQYTFEQKVGHMYNKLMTSTKHNYKAKPFGIDEWGIRPATVNQKLTYFQQAINAIHNKTFPNLKAYIIFDQNDGGSPTGTNLKVAYDDSGVYHKELQDKYNGVVSEILGTSTSTSQPASTNTPLPPTTTSTPASPQSEPTVLQLELFLHGIGNGGDNLNPKGGNFKLLHNQRDVTVDILTTQNTLLLTQSGKVSFDTSSGSFKGMVTLQDNGKIVSGYYLVKVKLPQSAKTQISGIQNLKEGIVNVLPVVRLITGDINNDNTTGNVMDYNLLINCYDRLIGTTNCTPIQKSMADLTDDGKVNQYDFNLFLRELTKR